MSCRVAMCCVMVQCFAKRHNVLRNGEMCCVVVQCCA